MELDARLQPHLGRVKDNYGKDNNMNMLALAKVTKVHHKQGTADLQLIKSNAVISSGEDNEGKFSARSLTTNAHYDPILASSSGSVVPLQEGQLVLVAFIDGNIGQPVILGSFHQTWETEHNVLPMHYPLTPEESMEDKRDATKTLDVHPSQFYKRIDGIGSMEMSHPSKTFLQVDPDLYGEISDGHRAYDHNNLNEKDPHTGSTRSAREEETAFPVNVLFVHRSAFDDEITTWTKMFLNSQGMLRLTRDNNDGTLSYMEMSDDGTMKLRRQDDSNQHGEGETYSEMGIGQDGVISIGRVIDGASSTISIDSTGDIILAHKDGATIKLSGGGDNSQSGGSVVVGKVEDPEWANGTLWIDTSDM